MTLHPYASELAATTSHSVSSLARDARAVLDGAGGRDATADLIRRIDGLRADWAAVPNAPIHVWLNNLRRRVERA